MTTPRTPHYLLNLLGQGGTLSDDGYKFGVADRMLMDLLMYLGAQGHVHDGGDSADATPDSALVLSLSTTGGNLPAGTRVYYKYGLVAPNGLETAASPESYVNTPNPIATPGSPEGLSTATTGGTLLPGQYYYRFSAYKDANTVETLSGNPGFITVPTGTATNTVTVGLPAFPPGADGFNVYRQRPGGGYFWIADIPNTATPPTEFLDDGSYEDDCNRFLPNTNRTGVGSQVLVQLPGATPTLPEGWTWRIYRTTVSGNYVNALAHWAVEETFEGSGIVISEWIDLGLTTTVGSPLTDTLLVFSPEKIQLEDAANVQGHLPMGSVSGFPVVVPFHKSGILSTTTGVVPYVVEFPQATVVGARAVLNDGSTPASSSVIVDVNRNGTTLYTDQADRPRVSVGDQVGDRSVPAVTELVEGDIITVDIDQVGGGATPTDDGLTVNVYLIAYGYDLVSHVWA